MADTPTIQAGGGEGPAELPDTATLPNDAAPAKPDNAPVKTEEIKEAPKVTEPQAAPETKPEAVKTDDLPAQPEKQVISEASEQVKEVQAPEVKAVESSDQVKVVETPEQVKVVETPEQVKVVEAAEQVKIEGASTQNGETTSVQEASKEQGDVAALVLLEDGDWKQREEALLRKIAELEQVENVAGDDALKSQLKVREEEIDLLKARVKNLETQLQAAISKPGAKNQEMIESIKQQHEELLSKARGMIFDKTKMVKNQELQIEALTTQVQSLKDINLITKDLLEIRNQEVKAMEDRLEAMEARFKAEKQRYSMIVQRAETSTNLNGDLKKEYTTQLGLFKELREKYEERVQALVSENARLKETLQVLKESSGLGTSTPSSEPAPQGPSA